MKLEQIAKTAHSVHLAYCKIMNLKIQPEWNELSENHKDTILDSVSKILNGKIKSEIQSHDNFVAFKRSKGWTYSKDYSLEKKTNPRLTRYDNLPIEDRAKETLFFNCVKSFM